MTAYCTKADLVERFELRELVELTDHTNTPPTTADDAEITKSCDEAASLIDSYLAARYATPLNPVPTLIRKLACDITRKFLWKDRADRDHPVSTAHNQALRILKDIAEGVAALPDAAGNKPAVTGGMAYTSPTRVFNTDGLLDAA